MNTNSGNRDFSKTDGIPNDRWSLAEIIYRARKVSAWGKSVDASPPTRTGYMHGKQVADFDLALDCAKAVLAAGYRL